LENVILSLAFKYGIPIQKIISTNELGLDFQTSIGESVDGKKWILRVPRRKNIFSQIQKEQGHLNFLKSKVSFDVPDWKVVNPELIAYPLLTDKPALEVNPATQEFIWNVDLESYKYSQSLGLVLYELHQLTQEAHDFGLPLRTPEKIRKELLDEIDLVKTQLGLSNHLEEKWRTWIDDDTYWPSFSTIIHGDLYAGHTLVNSEERITGIIDWSEMQIGDSSIDFAGQYIGLGEIQLDKTLLAYEKLGGITWPRMKEHIIQRTLAAPLKFGVFALKTKDDNHIQAAKEQLNS
jgi:macrolide phosphotransferase